MCCANNLIYSFYSFLIVRFLKKNVSTTCHSFVNFKIILINLLLIIVLLVSLSSINLDNTYYEIEENE